MRLEFFCDGGPSGTTHIGPSTRVMTRRMEGEENEVKKNSIFMEN